jgi:hypothetical protein
MRLTVISHLTLDGVMQSNHLRLPGRRAAGRDPGRLVPVILGDGIPWLAGTRSPVRLSGPEVVEDRGVTHLRYAVRRPFDVPEGPDKP